MTLNEYQQMAQRTSSTSGIEKLTNGVMGLNGEAGECIDLVKKSLFQGHSLNESHLIEELGDVLWYCAEVASGLGIGLEKAASWNIEKLKRRYPDGFESERSVNRDEN